VNAELRKAQRYKAAEGVDFVQYTRHGIKVTEENK
jgi:hypothetical protein